MAQRLAVFAKHPSNNHSYGTADAAARAPGMHRFGSLSLKLAFAGNEPRRLPTYPGGRGRGAICRRRL